MKIKFEWEKIDDYNFRAKVFGGWLIQSNNNYHGKYQMSVAFIPDPNHLWEIEK